MKKKKKFVTSSARMFPECSIPFLKTDFLYNISDDWILEIIVLYPFLFDHSWKWSIMTFKKKKKVNSLMWNLFFFQVFWIFFILLIRVLNFQATHLSILLDVQDLDRFLFQNFLISNIVCLLCNVFSISYSKWEISSKIQPKSIQTPKDR